MFGNPADILPSDEVVAVGLPSLSAGSGQQDEDDEGADAKQPKQLLRHSEVLEDAGSSDEEDSDDDDGTAAAAAARGASTTELVPEPSAGPLAYERLDPVTGAPEPLAPELVTLSLLPRSQWQSLVHLEAIKARNRWGGDGGEGRRRGKEGAVMIFESG